MSERVWNFSAGPATLPLSVIEQVRDELPSLPGLGMSALEISHRSPWFEGVIAEAERTIRELLGAPTWVRILFVQGGASLQFAMVPMNLLRGTDTRVGYVVTGSWSDKAVREAGRFGEVPIAWSGEETGFSSIPNLPAVSGASDAAYLHVTSNETIQGVEFPSGFEPADGPTLVCDASSDFLSRPLAVERYGLLYAGAQKNAGPAGVTVVAIREDVLERIPDGLPRMLDYRTYARSGSLYNTPPVFAIYVLTLVTRWLKQEIGGLEEMERRNREKAALLYEAIDGSDGFYRGHAVPEARSLMNVTFRLPDETLEGAFVAEAAAEGLVGVKGHRSVGGIRASIYNAMPAEGAKALRSFMDDFRSRRA